MKECCIRLSDFLLLFASYTAALILAGHLSALKLGWVAKYHAWVLPAWVSRQLPQPRRLDAGPFSFKSVGSTYPYLHPGSTAWSESSIMGSFEARSYIRWKSKKRLPLSRCWGAESCCVFLGFNWKNASVRTVEIPTFVPIDDDEGLRVGQDFRTITLNDRSSDKLSCVPSATDTQAQQSYIHKQSGRKSIQWSDYRAGRNGQWNSYIKAFFWFSIAVPVLLVVVSTRETGLGKRTPMAFLCLMDQCVRRFRLISWWFTGSTYVRANTRDHLNDDYLIADATD